MIALARLSAQPAEVAVSPAWFGGRLFSIWSS
jgi:hypothetical protein